MTVHRVELDSVKKHRNASEWRNVNRARCGEIEAVGDGRVEVESALSLLEAGMAGKMAVFRGERMVFGPWDVADWAAGRAPYMGRQPEHLRRAVE